MSSRPTASAVAPAGASLRFLDLHRNYGRLRVLRGVAGRVGPGEVLRVAGSNGSGKSTLLRCLAGLLRPRRGTIELRLDGTVLDDDERRRAVGFLSPDLDLYGELGCLENLQFFARLRRVDPDRGRALLERLGLPLDRPAAALSSGMRQRLRWSWALLHSPHLLLLDEPLANLDAPGRRDVLALLAEHLAAGGAAVYADPQSIDVDAPGATLDLDRQSPAAIGPRGQLPGEGASS